MTRFFAILALAVLLPFAAQNAALAENADEGLYDPVPPPGSAYVRFINVDPDVNDEGVDANGKEYSDVPFAEMSPYYVFPKGEVKASFEEASTTLKVESGKFYTLVLSKDKIVPLTDPTNTNGAKALVTLYNLSKTPEAVLKTADGKITVTETPAKSGALSSRVMNAVKFTTAVYSGDTKIMDGQELALERGKSYAVVLYDDKEGAPHITNFIATTDTKK